MSDHAVNAKDVHCSL